MSSLFKNNQKCFCLTSKTQESFFPFSDNLLGSKLFIIICNYILSFVLETLTKTFGFSLCNMNLTMRKCENLNNEINNFYISYTLWSNN